MLNRCLNILSKSRIQPFQPSKHILVLHCCCNIEQPKLVSTFSDRKTREEIGTPDVILHQAAFGFAEIKTGKNIY